MTLPVVLRPEARDDFATAHGCMNGQRPGLGDSFAEAMHEVLENIADHAELFEKALGDVRRARVQRFPYVVYFRKHTQRIEVLGVLHGSRHPGVWQGHI